MEFHSLLMITTQEVMIGSILDLLVAAATAITTRGKAVETIQQKQKMP